MLNFRKAKELQRWTFKNGWALVLTEYANGTQHYYLLSINSNEYTNIPHNMAKEMIQEFEFTDSFETAQQAFERMMGGLGVKFIDI